MRLIKQNIEKKTGAGTATLLLEEPEDMWHAYNLIRPNDLLRASAVRKVINESSSGSRSNERVHTTLTIRVTKLDFDPQAAQLHVSGRVAEENKIVKLGSFHTLDLELQRNFQLEKSEGWDSVALDMLKEAINQDAKAQLWAVIMKEGLANICLVTDHQTILRQKIETTLPRKRAGSTDHDKQLQKFFQTTFDSLLRQIDIANPLPLLLASPAFTASQFQQYIKDQAASSANAKQLNAVLAKTTIAPAASGYLHSLAEVLASPAVTSKLSDTKFARETQLVDRFFELMRKEDARAWYGPRECEHAVAQGAVGKGGGVLLISNGLFRSQQIETRKRWVKLVDDVKEGGGEVRVLSSMHESGRRLESLGGVAVILTYPIEDLDEVAGGGDEDGEDEAEIDQIDGDVLRLNGVEGRVEHEEDIDLL
ncbi:Translation factor pelota [Recurvomyces mirabilis]|nr:Translation factor pelota [Recurvomyces mirabilis]